MIWKSSTTAIRYSRWKSPFTRVGVMYQRLDTLSHDVQPRHSSPLSNRVGPTLPCGRQCDSVSCTQSGGMGVLSLSVSINQTRARAFLVFLFHHLNFRLHHLDHSESTFPLLSTTSNAIKPLGRPCIPTICHSLLAHYFSSGLSCMHLALGLGKSPMSGCAAIPPS